MARFYADIQGNRGEGTRCGTKKSGIGGHIRGRNIGCSVDILYDKDKEKDVMTVYLTSGSNGHTEKVIGEFEEVGYGKEPKKIV